MKLDRRTTAALVKPGIYGPDGHGLYLRVSPTGGKAWVYRYTRHGRARNMGLGSLELVTVEEARVKRDAARRTLKNDGLDPIEARGRRSVLLRDAYLLAQHIAAQGEHGDPAEIGQKGCDVCDAIWRIVATYET